MPLKKTSSVLIFRILIVIGLIVLGAWMYGPALSLPPSLVDEYVFKMNSERWQANRAEHGLRYAIENDLSLKMETYNIGLFILNGVLFEITDGKPFHWFRLLQLVFVCALLLRCVIFAGERSAAGFYAGAVTVAIFLLSEVPNAHDLQALRVNWYRLGTSDVDGLLFLSIFASGTIQLVRTFDDNLLLKRLGYSTIIIASACLAFSMKLPFVAIGLGTLCCVGVGAMLCRDKKLAAWMAGLAVCLGVLFSVYFLVLRSIHIAVPGETYGDNFRLSLGQFWSGFIFFGHNYWHMYGPLLVGVTGLAVWTVPTMWRDRIGPRKSMFLCTIFAAAFTACSIGIYLPWGVQLPRYMLTSIFGLLLLGGIVGTFALQGLVRIWRDQKWYMILLPAGVAIALLPAVPFWLFTVGAVALIIIHRGHASAPVLCGIALAGFVYLFAVSPALKSGVKYVYMNREKANWDATMALMRYSARERNVCFVGDVSNELVGSMTGYIFKMGIPPMLFPTTSTEKCTSTSVILVLNGISPPDEIATATNGRQVAAEYGLVQGEFPVPVSFWTFRNRLWQQSDVQLTVDYWRSGYVWRYFE